MRIAASKDKQGNRLEFADFNVIVGGNSVGKTTLLLELYALATETARQRWFWLDPTATPEYETVAAKDDLELLFGSFARRYDGGNSYYFSKATRNPEGTVEQDGKWRFQPSEFTTVQEAIQANDDAAAKTLLLSAVRFWRPFISLASCETRLSLTGRVPVTPLDSPPQDALNVLHRDRSLQREIDELIHRQFTQHIALLGHTLTQLDFGLSKESPPLFNGSAENLESEHARIDAWMGDNFTPIGDVGHGIRSMVKLLISLQDPISQIVLIDEPEMHIHPAQKRWLGLQLFRLAREQGKQIFMVTHDPIILQGILDSAGNTRILRISLTGENERHIEVCDLRNLEGDVGAKRNQDSYLQALFYQRAIAVEGAADRAFYQVMIEELHEERRRDKDLGFVACGGVGASKNVAYLASKVGLLSALIYDFDVLINEIPVIKDIMAYRGKSSVALDAIRDLVAKATEEEIKEAKKYGPESALVKSNLAVFEQGIVILRQAGIHIVPYGTVESWAPGVENKARFPELAPDLIKADDVLSERLRSFLAEVLTSVGC